MLTIENGEPIEPTHCADCGGVTTNLVRFVYQDGDAYAIYYARYSDNHPQREVALAVGLGDFSEESTPDTRVSFRLKMRLVDAKYEVMVVDPDQSLWPKAKVIGRTLTRAEALAHPRIKDVFNITDHMTTDDPKIKTYFEAQLRNA